MKSNSPKKSRDAGSGRYVTRAYAKANPGTTLNETGDDEMNRILKKLRLNGGAIVNSEDLSDEDQQAAIAEGRFAHGFVYVPIEEAE